MDIYTAMNSINKLENFIINEFDFAKGMYRSTMTKLKEIDKKCNAISTKLNSSLSDAGVEDKVSKAVELTNQLNILLSELSASEIESSRELKESFKSCADIFVVDEDKPPATDKRLENKLDAILDILKNSSISDKFTSIESNQVNMPLETTENEDSNEVVRKSSVVTDQVNASETDCTTVVDANPVSSSNNEEHTSSSNSLSSEVNRRQIFKRFVSTMEYAKTHSTNYPLADVAKDLIVEWFQARFCDPTTHFKYRHRTIITGMLSITLEVARKYASYCKESWRQILDVWPKVKTSDILSVSSLISDIRSNNMQFALSYELQSAMSDPDVFVERYGEYKFTAVCAEYVWYILTTTVFKKICADDASNHFGVSASYYITKHSLWDLLLSHEDSIYLGNKDMCDVDGYIFAPEGIEFCEDMELNPHKMVTHIETYDAVDKHDKHVAAKQAEKLEEGLI